MRAEPTPSAPRALCPHDIRHAQRHCGAFAHLGDRSAHLGSDPGGAGQTPYVRDAPVTAAQDSSYVAFRYGWSNAWHGHSRGRDQEARCRCSAGQAADSCGWGRCYGSDRSFWRAGCERLRAFGLACRCGDSGCSEHCRCDHQRCDDDRRCHDQLCAHHLRGNHGCAHDHPADPDRRLRRVVA